LILSKVVQIPLCLLNTLKNLPLLFLYIDDIIIIRNNNEKNEKVKKYLKKEFDIKDLGQLSYFLGVEIATSSKGLFLSQR
jgi:Reverse transcriptase (RNA-dependent DNA polymerase)